MGAIAQGTYCSICYAEYTAAVEATHRADTARVAAEALALAAQHTAAAQHALTTQQAYSAVTAAQQAQAAADEQYRVAYSGRHYVGMDRYRSLFQNAGRACDSQDKVLSSYLSSSECRAMPKHARRSRMHAFRISIGIQ